MKLQGGEYVSYGKVEAVLKTSALIESICLHADPSQDFVVCIAVPNMAALGETLSGAIGIKAPPATADSCTDESVQRKVIQVLTEYGLKNGLEKFELPKKIALVMDEWTPDSGLVTAAFKIRRRFIVEKYQNLIDAMYAS